MRIMNGAAKTVIAAAPVAAGTCHRRAAPAEPPRKPVDLDVMFIGAHPDDEAGQLGMLGYWNEQHDIKAGVITMTRGEGGGNAVGLEEGPPLGIIREDEERRAIGWAGVEHIYNLDARRLLLHRQRAAVRADLGLQQRPVPNRAGTPHHPAGGHHHDEPLGHPGQPRQPPGSRHARRRGVLRRRGPERLPRTDQEGRAQARGASRGSSRPVAAARGANGPTCETAPFTPSEPTNVVFGTWQGYERRGTTARAGTR